MSKHGIVILWCKFSPRTCNICFAFNLGRTVSSGTGFQCASQYHPIMLNEKVKVRKEAEIARLLNVFAVNKDVIIHCSAQYSVRQV